MNNNFYDIPVDWYNGFNTAFPFSNMENNTLNNNIDNLKNAFLRGNLFNNLYYGYKNYKYTELTPKNKREEILYNLLKYNFAMKELELYLDVYPDDKNSIELYKQYLMEFNKLSYEYEKNFGPLCSDSNYLDSNNWNWVNGPWPWEGDK